MEKISTASFFVLKFERHGMAKPTGFLDYGRMDNGSVPPMERILNFREFHPKLDEKARSFAL